MSVSSSPFVNHKKLSYLKGRPSVKNPSTSVANSACTVGAFFSAWFNLSANIANFDGPFGIANFDGPFGGESEFSTV